MQTIRELVLYTLKLDQEWIALGSKVMFGAALALLLLNFPKSSGDKPLIKPSQYQQKNLKLETTFASYPEKIID